VSYLALAVAFIWLGIGSVMARRWARALLLIMAWSWLAVGVSVISLMAIFQVEIFSGSFHRMPATVRWSMIAMAGLLVLMLVFVPVVLALFYGSRSVKATCEARDPIRRWTDACPLPVLGLSLLLAGGALSSLVSLLVEGGALPVFGTFLTGAPARLVSLATTAATLYAAWALYRVTPTGWWVTLIIFVVGDISVTLSFARLDPIEWSRLEGFSAQQLQVLRDVNFFNRLTWFSLITSVPLLGYLVWVRKFFARP
jgi:hypothetical protein